MSAASSKTSMSSLNPAPAARLDDCPSPPELNIRSKTDLSSLRLMTICLFSVGCVPVAADWSFTEISESVHAAVEHGISQSYSDPRNIPMEIRMSGGVAAGDYDRDGDTDLYVITGDANANVLLRNDGPNGFSSVADFAGLSLPGHQGAGPVFADLNGDGWQDLTVGGIKGSGMRMFRNEGDGSFSEITANCGILKQNGLQNDFSTAFGDPDGDGDLDMYSAHWGADNYIDHLWVNSGFARFQAADTHARLRHTYSAEDWSFTPTFSDINSDGLQDLLIVGDYSTSHVLLNRGKLIFENTTTEDIDDLAGMGSAVADFDNDGDMDWFVTAIWYDENYYRADLAGNRLYLNDGTGTFSNNTTKAGVRYGDWGWSACAADFNNDGWLDLFQVNGMDFQENYDFEIDPSRLFLNKGDGTFVEKAIDLGIDDRSQGRGLVCFDHDLDGDIDIFTANFLSLTRLYRNDLEDNPGYLQVQLVGEANNPSAIGSRIELTTENARQLREITVGSNYQSQNPLVQHFGLGGVERIDELRVWWPHGGESVLKDIEPNQKLTLTAEESSPPPFAMQPGMSSTWYDPAHDGEGFVLELLPGNVAVLYWFTYDAEGNQDWYFAQGEIKGRRILFPELLRVTGGEFGPGFNPENIRRTAVGSAAFTFTGCDSGFMDWSMGEDMGRQELVRLTRVMGLTCGETQMPDSGIETHYSGSWYDPTHDGEGYTMEVLPDDRALVYWFSFDPEGNRRWFFGAGEFSDDKLIFDNMLTTRGGRFGSDFDPDDVVKTDWGSLELDVNCDNGSANYESSEGSFGSGTLNVQRLTTLWQLECKQNSLGQ